MGHWGTGDGLERMAAVLLQRVLQREKETMKFCGSLGVGKALGEDLRDEFHERRF